MSGQNTTIAVAAKELWQRATMGTGFAENMMKEMKERSDQFEFGINLKIAEVPGFAVPPALPARADAAIEGTHGDVCSDVGYQE
jgi:hypothetical protein